MQEQLAGYIDSEMKIEFANDYLNIRNLINPK
jgi:hypothetical protein